MKRRRVGVVLAGALLVAGCGGVDEPATDAKHEHGASTSADTAPQYVETGACREGADPVLEILRQAFADEDVRDVAARLAAIEQMGTVPLAQCSPELSSAIRETVSGLSCSLDIAMAETMDEVEAPPARCGTDGAAAYGSALNAMRRAESAIQAKN